MADLEEKRRKGAGRPPGDAPMDPDKVFEIIDLKDVENLRWRQIGNKMGMSHQGPYLLYKKWRDWAARHRSR